jgi:hypothetical protein
MSDEYTPTKAEVRNIYASGSFVQTGPNSYDVDEERGGAEFDRFLAEHDATKADIAEQILGSEAFLWLMAGGEHTEHHLAAVRQAWTVWRDAGGKAWGER